MEAGKAIRNRGVSQAVACWRCQVRTIETIREFKTKRFTVRVKAVEDCDVDLSFDETGEVRKGLESGEFMAFGVVAKAYLDGVEIAEDSLWGCIYRSTAEFMDHKECGEQTRKLRESGSNAICGSYFADMVSSVCHDARKAIGAMQSVRVRNGGAK